ncbi:MAG: DUF169 domain-containing protein [Candidatus Bathyarchaeota archaeon]|nr:MAG: DUF169 domain-containing protein [Candidatus Bathyarchaeota archaeon]
MAEYDWSVYERDWLGYPPRKQGEILIRELRLHGDPVALAWWPEKLMSPEYEEHIYRGPLKLVHCQFMMRARYRGEVYVLDGITSRPDPPVCNGDAYVGLTTVSDDLMTGAWSSRTNPDSGDPPVPRIYGTPVAARRNLLHDYTMVPPNVKYLGIAPLSECPFDPDVVVLFGNPRQMTYACRALQWWSGITPKSLTGPGTCSSSWAAAYISGEPKYTLGCFGLFSAMGVNPNHVSLSIPSEMMPPLCSVLELWRDRGRETFNEAPPDEEREYIRAPYDGEYTKDDYRKPDFVSWNEHLEEPYETWAERRRKKGFHVPEDA